MPDTRVLLVDDHRVFTELLGYTLDAQPGIRCVARARTCRAALEITAATGFDAAVVDLQLPDGDGLELARTLRAHEPRARVIVLTAFPTPGLTADASEHGIPVLAKDGSLDLVLRELRAAEPGTVADITLTGRERQVVELISEGLSPVAIARALGISPHTVREHVKALLRKTGTTSQIEALAAVRRAGLLDPEHA